MRPIRCRSSPVRWRRWLACSSTRRRRRRQRTMCVPPARTAPPLIPAVDAGNGAATEALALVAAAVTSFHASFAVQTAVVATAVSLGVADTVAADGTTASMSATAATLRRVDADLSALAHALGAHESLVAVGPRRGTRRRRPRRRLLGRPACDGGARRRARLPRRGRRAPRCGRRRPGHGGAAGCRGSLDRVGAGGPGGQPAPRRCRDPRRPAGAHRCRPRPDACERTDRRPLGTVGAHGCLDGRRAERRDRRDPTLCRGRRRATVGRRLAQRWCAGRARAGGGRRMVGIAVVGRADRRS